VLTLAIETSSPRGSVALCADGKVIAERHHQRADAHAEALLPLLDELLRDAGIQRFDLTRIAVGVGPGSFTGLRVGIALAQGLATGLGKPALGVPSLASLAWSKGGPVGPELVGALLDARRGELFFSAFDASHRVVVEPVLVPVEGLREQLETYMAGRPFRLAGNVGRDRLPADWFLAEAEFPTASATALLADSALALADTTPLYLREPELKLAPPVVVS
jgi:tRNA threonylcarbamoyladenosine biosynthesis protein TsaB